jgi:hypothetical protein
MISDRTCDQQAGTFRPRRSLAQPEGRATVLGFSFFAPRKGLRSMSVVPASAAAALIALAACQPAAAPSSTSGLAPSSMVSQALATGAPASIAGPVRPPGVPTNAQPLLFGCEDGLARCTDIAPGTYYTAGEWALLPGLAFTLPAGWSSLANEAGELELHLTGDDHDEILVWRDVVPWLDGHAAVDVASDPEAWITRLAGDPCLDVSEPERVGLGRWIDLRGGQEADLQAIAVSVGVSNEPAYESAGCPGSGLVEILSDPMHWDHSFAIGRAEMNGQGCPCLSVQRLYFASIGYVNHKHLLVVALQSYGPTVDVNGQMASLQVAAQPVLDSLIAPAIVVDN